MLNLIVMTVARIIIGELIGALVKPKHPKVIAERIGTRLVLEGAAVLRDQKTNLVTQLDVDAITDQLSGKRLKRADEIADVKAQA